eukprot:1948404-Lingulodinium_polyedra.AAC.1
MPAPGPSACRAHGRPAQRRGGAPEAAGGGGGGGAGDGAAGACRGRAAGGRWCGRWRGPPAADGQRHQRPGRPCSSCGRGGPCCHLGSAAAPHR